MYNSTEKEVTDTSSPLFSPCVRQLVGVSSLFPPLGSRNPAPFLTLLFHRVFVLFCFFWDRDSHGLPSKTPCSLRRTLNSILLPKPAKCRDYYTHNSGWGSFQSFFSLLVPLAYAYWKCSRGCVKAVWRLGGDVEHRALNRTNFYYF